MRLREVFRYEFAYRIRSRSTWIQALFLFLVIGWGTLATADGHDAIHANAPQQIAQLTVLFGGMFGLLVSASVFGDAAVRDVAAGMDPLLFTTRLRTGEFLGGRFLAALAVNAILVVAIPLGHIVATMTPLMQPGTLGPFRPAAYLQPLLLFLLPNLVLVGAILFSIGSLTRQVVPVFLAAIGIFIGYIAAANYWHTLGNPTLSVLGDPLGINALAELYRFRPPAEQNARLIGVPSILILNRVIWLAVGGGVLAVLHRVFRFAHVEGGGSRRKRDAIAGAPVGREPAPAVPRTTGTFGRGSRARQALAVARRSFGDALAGRPFRAVLVGAVGVVLLMGWNVTETVFDTATWPVTQLVAGTVLSHRIAILPWVVIILYAGELVWKDRETGMAEIADAAPVPEWVALVGRFLALVAMIAAIEVAFVAGGILMQALQGYYHFEPGLYLRMVFGFDFIEYVLLAALVMTVHVLVNQKYAGHAVALMTALFTKVAPGMGLRHHLLVYNTDPGWRYSDMNGFGPFAGPYAWFKAYWAAWALVLGVIAVLFWVRGRESGLRHRFAAAGARFVGPVAAASAVAIVLILGLGGFIFYNTNVLNRYRSRSQAGADRARYELRYARFAAAPQPMITDADLRIEIHPERSAVSLGGSYRLVNRTGIPIDSVHIYLEPKLQARSFAFDRPARAVLADAEAGYRIYALDRPLAPGDSIRLTFDVGFEPRGFPNDGLETDVVRNGAYLDREWLPFIGYQRVFELTDADARRRFGLGLRAAMPGQDDMEARQYRDLAHDANLVRVKTIIGTAPDQTAITAGLLRRSWTANGRRYFEYESEGPTSFGVPIMSARYEVLRDEWNGVPLEIYHHPAHRADLASTLRGMKASLDYYTRTFGPYRFRQLRIVEVPPYDIGGRAHAGTIAFSEELFFGRAREGEIDQTFYAAAHEIGHQWQVGGAVVRGIGFLTESFANYSAMTLTGHTFGPEAARRAYAAQMTRYLLGRVNQSREVPLLDVENQPYIMYRKGAVALYLLRDYIGEDAVDSALRRFLDRYRDAGPPYPTSRELYAELRAVTPDSLQSLLTDLFETVTLWDVRAKRAVAEPTGSGGYRVTLDVEARKVRADSLGREHEVPMDDLVEIGVFGPDSGGHRGEPLHLGRHRVHGGAQTITVTVPRKPARAGIDPRHMLIDRDGDDNVADVTVATSPRQSGSGPAPPP